MDFHIKNMVCRRCISAVDSELRKHGLNPTNIQLGLATITEENISDDIRTALTQGLKDQGFEMLDSSVSRIVDRIKSLIIDKIHHHDRLDLKVNWSDYIAEQLHQDYNNLSSLFSSVEGITIEQFIIRQKIEKTKELLIYDEKNLSEIAFLLEYSSVQHLSTQFKKVTGLTPSQFKRMQEPNLHRKALDSI